LDEETMGMSRRELVAWLGFLGAAAGGIYLGWLLFLHWPGGAFDARHESVASPISGGFTVYILLIAALQNWRRNEPLEDERDRAIGGVAAKHGFYALALLNVVGGVVVQARPGLVLQSGAEWIRYGLLWMVLVALAVHGASQLHGYRRG
jgi:hypothetical protein